jgi:general secretion pathway protein I
MRAARGFTLLEVLVSFVILAAASALLLGMLSGGLRQVARARSDTEASLFAQSTLDQLGVTAPIEAGVAQGEYDGGRYHWRMEITPADDPAPAPPDPEAPLAPPGLPGAQPLLFRVVLDVRWGEAATQALHIATLRARMPAQVAVP